MAQPTPHFAVHGKTGKTTQDFRVGSLVNVGFIKNLLVSEIVPTPGDYAPDAYILVASNGRRYEFVPHKGLSRIEGAR